MSSWARAWAYEQRVGQEIDGEWRKNPGAKSVLAAICEFPDQDGRCYVGQETLAGMCDMGVRTVRRHLDFLEDTAGLIRREERRRADGTRTSDYIWVLAPADRLRPPSRSDAPAVPPKPQPANLAAGDPGGAPSTGQIRHDNRPDSTRQPANLAGPLLIDPSGEPSGDPSGNEEASYEPSSAGSPEAPGSPPASSPMEMGRFGVVELAERVRAKREGGASVHSPTEREKRDFGAQFRQLAKDGGDLDLMLLALDYMVAKAAGEVEGEPRAWCGYRTAFDRVSLDGWRPPGLAGRPVSDAEREEAARVAEENRREWAELMGETG